MFQKSANNNGVTESPGVPLATSAPSPEERVYAAIHAAIQDHRLVPGTKLKELTLAELFGVSRAVVRKVLERLAHMQLVDLRPNRAALVATPTEEESRQIFHARRTIESAIAVLAAERATPREVAALRHLVQAERSAYESNDARTGLQHSIEFHRRLAAIAGNEVLARFLDELISRMPLVLLTHRSANAAVCAVDEHSPIVDAIATRDCAHAAALVHAHLRHLEREAIHERPTPPVDLASVFAPVAA